MPNEERLYLIQEHIPEESTVWNGYANGYSTAPSEPGFYTLYEIADRNNQHVGWKWVKEGEQERNDDW